LGGTVTALDGVDLKAPTEARIFFGDTDVPGLAPHKRAAAMVFQNYGRSTDRWTNGTSPLLPPNPPSPSTLIPVGMGFSE